MTFKIHTLGNNDPEIVIIINFLKWQKFTYEIESVFHKNNNITIFKNENYVGNGFFDLIKYVKKKEMLIGYKKNNYIRKHQTKL